MADVFISYARDDEAFARRVAKGLQAAGLDVWWDADLPAHRAYSEEIERNLEAAKAVVVLWSAAAAKSQWVRAEADFARNAGKLVQGQVDGTLPPMPFNQIQCADLKGWRGNPKHSGWAKLKASVDAVLRGEQVPGADTPTRKRPLVPRWAAALGLVALMSLLAVLVYPQFRPVDAQQPRVAVLPFAAVAGSDQALVEGIWEDTRQALSRNPQLLVLGPNTSEELSSKGSRAARRAADYLLQARVRTAGDRVRVSTSLVRSRDDAQIWSETFDRKLDDVFALQTEIAQQIEGQIRGRLARGGGVLAEQITTSGEVYQLYSQARAAISRREGDMIAPHRQLQQAVRLDPNYAPAWAALSVTEYFTQPVLLNGLSTGKEPEAYARRAIRLAPNLAAGYAALGLVLGRNGPIAEAAIRRAMRLDPGDVETINSLAGIEWNRGRHREALELYSRAVEIEPLWWPAVLNRLGLWFDTDQQSAVDRELARLERLGDPKLRTLARIAVYDWRGDLSEATKLGLAYARRGASERAVVEDWIASLLLRLGHDEIAWSFSNAPPNAALMWKNDPKGFAMFEARNVPPAAFWRISPMSEVVSRTYVNNRREARLLQMYKGAASSPDEFLNASGHPLRFVHLAPIVAVAFRQVGDAAEADRLTAAADEVLEQSGSLLNLRERAIYSARIRALQGRGKEAVAALRLAIDRGWWPTAPFFKPDLAEDPPLALLNGDAEFARLRSRVLDQLAKERAELGPLGVGGTAATAGGA